MSEPEDHATTLLRLAEVGDEEAFAQLVRLTEPYIRAYLCRREFSCDTADLEDMVQETYLRAWRCRGRYLEKASARTYLVGIAKRVHLENLRSRSFEHAPMPDNHPDEVRNAEDLIALHETARFVERALVRLSRNQRVAFQLLHIDGHSPSEVAVTLGTSVKAIRRRSETARVGLRRMMTSCREPCTYDRRNDAPCPAEHGRVACMKYLILKLI